MQLSNIQIQLLFGVQPGITKAAQKELLDAIVNWSNDHPGNTVKITYRTLSVGRQMIQIHREDLPALLEDVLSGLESDGAVFYGGFHLSAEECRRSAKVISDAMHHNPGLEQAFQEYHQI